MKMNFKLALTLGAGIAVGAAISEGLHAQASPPTYAIIDISSITDAAGFKTIGPKAGPADTAAGGTIIIRTDNITAADGTPPKHLVVIAFDNLAKAKAWHASKAMQEVWGIQKKTSKFRVFFAEGMPRSK
jgi:uncharacterized protein (DUF1330 family)